VPIIAGLCQKQHLPPRPFTRDQHLGQHQAAHAHAAIEAVIHANSPSRRVRIA
jgi:hypothetical protein